MEFHQIIRIIKMQKKFGKVVRIIKMKFGRIILTLKKFGKIIRFSMSVHEWANMNDNYISNIFICFWEGGNGRVGNCFDS